MPSFNDEFSLKWKKYIIKNEDNALKQGRSSS